jgi:LPXTG-motif cell wall-anchored protein
MGIAMSNGLALVRWHGFRFLNGGITQGDIAWLLIGVALAVVAIWAYSRRRRRWF